MLAFNTVRIETALIFNIFKKEWKFMESKINLIKIRSMDKSQRLMFFVIHSCFLLTSLPSWALQHPTGFVTLEECIEQGNFIENTLQETDSQQFVLSLKNGVVVNEGGIITQEGKIFKDTETYKEDQHHLLASGRNIASENSISFKGRLVVISSPGQENWYHWLFQVLPRIKILVDSGIEYDKIYLHNMKFNWQSESLSIVMKHLKIPEDRLFLTTKDDYIIEATDLIVPSVPFIPSKSSIFPSWLKDFIQSTFLVGVSDANTPERIYISRSKAAVRRIANEASLVNLLEKKGFVTLNLEELPVQSQAEIFHNAKVIIGPHGSGFTNLIFSKPNTCVIEIDHGLNDERQRSFYKRMAQIMDCQYKGYYADLVEEENLEDDIEVNILDFNDFCAQLGIF
jgi:capsular polysaccharide biosynthesis protein